MFDKIFSKTIKIPKLSWVFLAIFVLAIFLRTWHFSDWMVFNPDQARDAMLVDDVLAGRESWPLLGPEAGNTHFSLGPWFYHLEIISAKIFGSDPWKLAIPDLIFSILTIPLFYFFVRKYFSSNISLLTTFFISISYFMVRYSRFAFNPNSIPFFVLLFLLGMLSYMDNDRRKKMGGGILAGIAIGVGMQLHILLFFIMPTIAGIIFLWLLFIKKHPLAQLLGSMGLALVCIAVLNTGQIIYFTRHTHNANTFKKAFVESSKEGNMLENILQNFIGQAQANLNLVSSWGSDEEINLYSKLKKIRRDSNKKLPYNLKNNHSIALTLLAVGYFVIGYWLLFLFWKKEKDERRKNFLFIVGIYGIVSFVAMLPIISQASLRYYIISFFLPFIFLGLFCEYALKKESRTWEKILIGGTVFIFVISQLQTINIARKNFENGMGSDKDYAIWGEVNVMMNYIKANSQPGEKVIIAGKHDYFSRFYKPLLYLGKHNGVDINRGDKTKKIKATDHVFFIQKDLPQNSDKQTFINRNIEGFEKFGKVTIINLKKL